MIRYGAFVIRKNGRTWNLYREGKLIEGGFFSLDAAKATADDLTREGC